MDSKLVKVGDHYNVDLKKRQKEYKLPKANREGSWQWNKPDAGQTGWGTIYPFNIEVLSIDNDPENSDRKFKLLNKRSGFELEVEDNWWNELLTGRVIDADVTYKHMCKIKYK